MDKIQDHQTFILNLQAAARELHCSTRTVLRAIERGELRGKKVGGRWLLSRRAVLAYGLGFGPRMSAVERKEFQDLTS